MKKRYKLAAFYIIISLVFPIPFSGLLCLIPKMDDFLFVAKYFFFMFSAFPCVSGLLLILTNIPEDLSFGFGAALYYGSLTIAAITQKIGWGMGDTDRIILGFIISALVCYIVYLEHFKSK